MKKGKKNWEKKNMKTIKKNKRWRKVKSICVRIEMKTKIEITKQKKWRNRLKINNVGLRETFRKDPEKKVTTANKVWVLKESVKWRRIKRTKRRRKKRYSEKGERRKIVTKRIETTHQSEQTRTNERFRYERRGIEKGREEKI